MLHCVCGLIASHHEKQSTAQPHLLAGQAMDMPVPLSFVLLMYISDPLEIVHSLFSLLPCLAMVPKLPQRLLWIPVKCPYCLGLFVVAVVYTNMLVHSA